MKYLYTIILIILSIIVFGQKADKIFKNFEKKEYLKAEEQFLKVLEKDTANCAANFGLAYIYSTIESNRVDYFKAWDYFRVAYRNQDKLDDSEVEALKLHIASIDSRRRSKPLNKNFDLEKDIIQDKLITYVREENNLEVAVRFIQEYPNSDYIENVYHIRNYIEFRKAENANTVAGYNLFIQNYPNAAQINTVKALRNKKAYKEAINLNTLQAISNFITKYPDAYEVFEAERLRNKLAFVEAKKLNTLQAIENFILQYPNSTEIADAMKIKRELLFEQAKSINTLEAYNNFVKLYPEGKQFVDIFNLKANVVGKVIKENNQISIGNELFVKGFDRNQSNDILKDIYPLNDRIYVAGKTLLDENNWDAWLIALESDGKMIWNKSFGQDFGDGLRCIEVANNGNLYLGGIMNAIGDSIKGISWLVKMTNDGQISWSKTLKGSKIKSISIDANENIYAGGSYIDSTNFKCQLFKLNNNGETIWTRNYIKDGEIEAVSCLNDSVIVFSGSNWIVNLSKDGYINSEVVIDNVNSSVFVGLNNNELYFAGVQDSTILHYGVLNLNSEFMWKKEMTFETKVDLYSFNVSFASLNILLYSEAEFMLYDFDFEGSEIGKKLIQKSTFTKKAVYKNFNGANYFGATAKTFGQNDMFLVKFQ
jgi:hypothetical protein